MLAARHEVSVHQYYMIRLNQALQDEWEGMYLQATTEHLASTQLWVMLNMTENEAKH